MYALEINHVVKKYKNFTALNNINFKVNQADIVGLLGVNGAGKTSLISSIAGINKFSGKIKVMGYDVVKDDVLAKKNLGIVPQELTYDPFLTVYETLKFQSGLYGVSNNKEWILELIERMYLQDKVDTNTRYLSGGMKRRLMVAQALVHKPPVIILDEPTAGVDVEIRKSLWQFITELHSQGHTILLTTHYLEEAEKLCNKIIMIDKGEVIAENSKSELVKQSHSLPTTMVIEIKDARLPEELNNLVINKEKEAFTLKLDNNDQVFHILNTIQKHQIKLENVNIHRPNLEDVFINCLKRKAG